MPKAMHPYERRLGQRQRNKESARDMPELDCMGNPYAVATTIRGVGGDAEKKRPNTHFVVVPSGIAHQVIESEIANIEAWLALPVAQREKVEVADAQTEAAG